MYLEIHSAQTRIRLLNPNSGSRLTFLRIEDTSLDLTGAFDKRRQFT